MHENDDPEKEEKFKIFSKLWSPRALVYDPLKAGSIDSTDTSPHDKAIIRALNADYKPNKRVKGDPECTLFVYRLSPSTKQETIETLFSKFGTVKRCRLVEDIVTGRSMCYAFVEMENTRQASRAYWAAHRQNVDGKEIGVDYECERLLPGWVPRRLGGGFGGRKESGQLRFGGRDRVFKKPICLMTSQESRKDALFQARRNPDYFFK